ncbi:MULTISPECIES: hypothetical protein [unclassified Rhodococcus (in: high G+C Gram-positive bacteria)]|uniref:hypothetical protein n=1 Tax=unclassified Rhodococcus (in: high G+C Gram-positive bacteria) TaxID=192944 RepID=UPI0015C62347|nr:MULTISPECIES: hypothetical protein [unclassified Rhodococcus (in: high G+C Gram-positive bacteria)]
MDAPDKPAHTQQVVLAMDHGQFYLRGGEADPSEMTLLERAMAVRPSAGDGSTVVVLSPHQNNFEMPIDIEVFGTRPHSDESSWQQVCEERIEIGPGGILQIDSTPMSSVECSVPPGRYVVQIAGRNFVNYGWPGTTTPGDEWRVRLWPDDGVEPRPAVRWNMPGYGVPADTEPPPEPEPDDDRPAFIWQFASDAEPGRLIERSELDARAAERHAAEWGGDPIPQVSTYNGGQGLVRLDRDLIVDILEASETTARSIAVWCAEAATDHARLSTASWVSPALAALREGRAMPAPFDEISNIGLAFAQLDSTDQEGGDEIVSSSASFVGRSSLSTTPGNPYDYPISPRHMAIPALYSAQDPDPYRAAVETLHHASATYSVNVADLHARLKEEFFGH